MAQSSRKLRELIEPHGEIRTACPHCGSDDVEDGNACKICVRTLMIYCAKAVGNELMTLDNALKLVGRLKRKWKLMGFLEYFFDKRHKSHTYEENYAKELESIHSQTSRSYVRLLSGTKERAQTIGTIYK